MTSHGLRLNVINERILGNHHHRRHKFTPMKIIQRTNTTPIMIIIIIMKMSPHGHMARATNRHCTSPNRTNQMDGSPPILYSQIDFSTASTHRPNAMAIGQFMWIASHWCPFCRHAYVPIPPGWMIIKILLNGSSSVNCSYWARTIRARSEPISIQIEMIRSLRNTRWHKYVYQNQCNHTLLNVLLSFQFRTTI